MMILMVHLPAATRLIAEINMERLRELQRFAEVGRVSASLIHDMSSPLTAVILHLDQEAPRGLPSIRHARRSIRVLERYVEAARQQLCHQDCAAVFCVKQEVYQIRYILQPLARKQRVRLCFSVRAGDRSLLGDPVKFQRIIINLVTNAIDAYPQDTPADKRSVRVAITTDHDHLVIRVRDRGRGIATGQLPRLFEPFYTTKQAGATGGLGIGLSVVKQYLEEDFSGTITVISNAGKGTEFKARLPLHNP